MTDFNAIRARLGSLSPQAIAKLPKAVQTLLKEDLPRLVQLAEATERVHGKHDSIRPGDFPTEMSRNWPIMIAALAELFPSPEQQIKEMPW